MKALVTGSNGLLGKDLVVELKKRGWDVTAVDIQELDITDPVAVASIAGGVYGKEGWLFNCAAYTNVDGAETDVDRATLLNSIAPGYLAQACAMVGKRMIQVSTDFVFDGQTSTPYAEDAPTHPLGVYGRTKLEGEEAVFSHQPSAIVIRTAWLYGPLGKCFPKTIVKAWESGKDLKVVDDQQGSPTYTADLVRVMVDLAEKNVDGGIYHTTGPSVCTWHDLAERTIRTWTGKEVRIPAIKTEEWPTPVRRPVFSVLSFDKCRALGIQTMRPLDEALSEFCERLRRAPELFR
jgi:dTDP-4-dehydrorhamnose reductase